MSDTKLEDEARAWLAEGDEHDNGAGVVGLCAAFASKKMGEAGCQANELSAYAMAAGAIDDLADDNRNLHARLARLMDATAMAAFIRKTLFLDGLLDDGELEQACADWIASTKQPKE